MTSCCMHVSLSKSVESSNWCVCVFLCSILYSSLANRCLQKKKQLYIINVIRKLKQCCMKSCIQFSKTSGQCRIGWNASVMNKCRFLTTLKCSPYHPEIIQKLWAWILMLPDSEPERTELPMSCQSWVRTIANHGHLWAHEYRGMWITPWVCCSSSRGSSITFALPDW